MNALVLMSGGLDSLACIAYYRDAGLAPEALFVDYGQPARIKEREAVTRLSNLLDLPLSVVAVTGVSTTAGYIAGRNAFLLNLALMRSAPGPGLISLGIHSGTSYEDCTEQFVHRMQAIFDVYSNGVLRIDAPFLSWSKVSIWNFLDSHQYPVNLTYSCEAGDIPCGKCLSCLDVQSLHAR